MKSFALFAAALAVVTSTSVAFGQALPGPAPAPAPAPGAPPKDAPGAEKGNGIPKILEPNRFRFSTAGTTLSMTTTAVGVGRDNIGSENDFVGLDYYFAPQWWFYDEKDHKFFVSGQIGASTELTDSNTTTTTREPQFYDATVGLGYNGSIYTSEDKAWLSRLLVRTRAILPTSPVSQGQGRYLTTSLFAGVLQTIPLLGNDAHGLNSLAIVPGVTWAHLFSRSYTPTNSDLERVRQSASGRTVSSDQVTFNSMDVDRIVPSVFASLPLYDNLSFNTTFRLIGRFRHDFEDETCVQTATGCVTPDRDENRVTYLTNSSVDLSLSYGIFDLAFFTVGYLNETLSIGEDGQRRNAFYSPDAQFYVDLSFQLSEIYKREVFPAAEANNPFVQARGPASGVSF